MILFEISFSFPDTSCSLVRHTWLCSYSRQHHSSKLFLEHFQHYWARYTRIASKARGNLKFSHIYFQWKKKVSHINVMFMCPSAERSELAAAWSDVIHLWLAPEPYKGVFHLSPNLYILNSECRNIKFKFICKRMSKKTGENILAKNIRRWWQWLWVCCRYFWQITE